VSHALRAFLAFSKVEQIVLVVASADLDRARSLEEAASDSVEIVLGGETRRESALAGLEAVRGDHVLIHDGARPFPSFELLRRVLEGAERFGACVPALPIVDTVRTRSEDGFLDPSEIDRSRLVRIQTPQGFRTSLLRRALPASPAGATDDAAAVLALGEPVATVPGDPENLKVTLPEDLPIAEAIGVRVTSACSD
jgi:2-C-methyl-D-erythritol 4-phosphate cytidylyltransferase